MTSTRPTTPRAALLEVADHLETAPDGATWLPPRSVAKMIREHAERYPAEATADDRGVVFARAFTEWDRRYREEPERFTAEAVRLLTGTPETYGDAVAPYFVAILDEQAGDQ
jgi:hypothetical protein